MGTYTKDNMEKFISELKKAGVENALDGTLLAMLEQILTPPPQTDYAGIRERLEKSKRVLHGGSFFHDWANAIDDIAQKRALGKIEIALRSLVSTARINNKDIQTLLTAIDDRDKAVAVLEASNLGYQETIAGLQRGLNSALGWRKCYDRKKADNVDLRAQLEAKTKECEGLTENLAAAHKLHNFVASRNVARAKTIEKLQAQLEAEQEKCASQGMELMGFKKKISPPE